MAATDRKLDWVGTALILLVAAVLRFWALGRPGVLVFDETYYVKDALTLWRLGFEAQWPADADAAFAAGNVSGYLPDAAFVVHPQVGKWLIALGLMVGGPEHAWAWRLSSAIAGVLAVWMVIRIARLLFGSTPLGLVAGGLMALDGLAITHSRTALLDQFLMVFVLAAFWALLADRTRFRNSPGRFRWWRLLAGVLLGLAAGVKWSAAYFVAGFGLLTVWWDLTYYRRQARAAGVPFHDVAWPWVRQALTAFVSLVPVAALTYLASWFSWFRSPGAWGRDWALANPGAGITWLPPALRSWVQYHSQMWTFHTGLSDPHPYQAQAWNWLMQIRPTAFYWATAEETAAYPGCAGFSQCTMAVNSVGNPILWWLAALSIFVTVYWGIVRRDWRALAVLSGIAFGWLPWLLYPERTTFTFYAIVFLPWMIFTFCYALNLLWNIPVRHPLTWTPMVSTPPENSGGRGAAGVRHPLGSAKPRWNQVVVVGLLAIIAITSMAFYPIWTAMPIERRYWELLMWLPSWV